MTLSQLREKRAEVHRQMCLVRDRNKKKDYQWTDADDAEWDRLDGEYKSLSRDISCRQAADELDAPADARNSDIGRGDVDHAPPTMRRARAGSTRYVDKSGAEIRTFAGDEPITLDEDRPADQPHPSRFSVGECIRGAITNNWRGAEESRAVLGSLDVSGGFAIAGAASLGILNAIRARSVCNAAGVRTVPMTTEEMTVGLVSTSPTATWAAEGQTVDDSDMQFGSARLKARTLRCNLVVSQEWLEDCVNGSQLIEAELAAQLALQLDAGILAGQGLGDAREPLGIRNVAGVQTVTSVGEPNHDDFSIAVGKLYTANAMPPFSMVASPRTGGQFDRFKDGEGQPLQLSPWVAALAKYWTTSVSNTEGAGGDESYAVLGNFSEILVGMRTAFRVFILPPDRQTYTRGVVAALRADVAHPRPSLFCVMSGITDSTS